MDKSKLPQWQGNMRALWVGNFANGAGASMSLPFLPLFIAQMGNFPKWELTLYAGTAFAIKYLTQALFSPLWGNLADRVGRKPMLLRASVGLTISATITGFASNFWFLIVIRAIQGAFSGYINNAYALVASEVPNDKSGSVMGKMTTGAVGGELIGPVIGGYLAGIFGYRIPFFIFGLLMLCASLITMFFVHEDFKPITKQAKVGFKEAFSGITHLHVVVGMFASALLIQSATNSIDPIVSLFVRQLMHNQGNVAFVSGIIAALPGVATLFAAPQLGKLGDKIGPIKVLILGLTFSGLVFLPMFFVTSVGWLGFLRLLIGIADAALLPVVQTVLTRETPDKAMSRIFSYYQSAQSLGCVIGPMLASAVAGIFNYRYVFLMTTVIVIINILVVSIVYRKDYLKERR